MRNDESKKAAETVPRWKRIGGGLTELRRDVLAALAENDDEPKSVREVKALVGDKSKWGDCQLSFLKRRGYVTNTWEYKPGSYWLLTGKGRECLLESLLTDAGREALGSDEGMS